MRARDFKVHTKSYGVAHATTFSLRRDDVDDDGFHGAVATPFGLVSVDGRGGRALVEGERGGCRPFLALRMYLNGRCYYYSDRRPTTIRGVVTIAGRFAREVARLAAKDRPR
jgi:hypothetical protein